MTFYLKSFLSGLMFAAIILIVHSIPRPRIKQKTSYFCEGTGYKAVTEPKEIKCSDLYSNETMPHQRWRRDFNTNGGNPIKRNDILMCGVFRSVKKRVTVMECCIGYTGSKCDQPLCDPVCQNGGTCIQPDICRCPPDYVGARCQYENGHVEEL